MKMSKGKKGNVLHIEIRGYYVYTKNLKDGLGLLIMEIDEKYIGGLKLMIGGAEKFYVKKEEFETLLAYNIIEYTETVPKDVYKEMSMLYTRKG